MKKLTFVLLLISLSVTSIKAQFTGLTIHAAITKLEQAGKNLIEKAGEEARTTIMIGSQQVQLQIDNLKYAYSESLDKTFDNLDITQQRVFNDLNSLIDNVNSGLYQTTKEIQSALDGLDESISRVPFFEKFPRVNKPEKLYFLKQGNTGNIPLSISGSRLNIYGNEYQPYLVVNNEEIKPTQTGSNTIEFNVPISKLSNFDKSIKTEILTLVVYHKVKKIFGLWNSYEKREFKIPLFGLPASLGTYRIGITERVEEKTEHSRHTSKPDNHYKCQSGRTSNRTCTYPTIVPTGHKLIHSSPRFHATRREENSPWEFINVSDAGFTLRLTAKTSSTNTARKNINGWVSYKTYTTKTLDTNKPNFSSGQLNWTKDVRIPVTDKTIGFTIEVETFNGHLDIYNSSIENKYFKILEDRINNQIIIKPMKPTSIMQ